MTHLLPFFNTIEIFIGSLHLAELQNITKKELKDKSGIYGFFSKTTNKLYIGSSINLNIRTYDHINGSKSNTILQNAINKYNLQDFIFVVFEYCEPEKLLSREQFYLDALKPEFNILKVAGSLLGYKHTEEAIVKMSSKILSAGTKEKISEAKKGDNNPMFGKTGENHPMFERKHLPETIIKNHEANSGKNHPMYGKQHSLETLAKMSIAKGGSTIYVYDSQGTLVNSFCSSRQAANFFNCGYNTILRYCKNEKLFQDKWILCTTPISIIVGS